MNKELLTKKAIMSGCIRQTEFPGVVPSFESTKLEKMDILKFPTEYEIFSECIGNVSNCFIFIETTDGQIRKFYPSMLFKRCYIYDENGNRCGRAYASGAVVDMARTCVSVNEVMEKLKGKMISVSDIKYVRTSFEDGYFYKTPIYTFDFA